MKKSTYFYYLIKVMFTPSCWTRNYPTSKHVDKILLSLLEEHKFKLIDSHKASIGEVVFWIANHPYASFDLQKAAIKFLPKRTTALYAYDRLIKDTAGVCSK